MDRHTTFSRTHKNGICKTPKQHTFIFTPNTIALTPKAVFTNKSQEGEYKIQVGGAPFFVTRVWVTQFLSLKLGGVLRFLSRMKRKIKTLYNYIT